jgi:hypothetical protein
MSSGLVVIVVAGIQGFLGLAVRKICEGGGLRFFGQQTMLGMLPRSVENKHL